MTISPRDKDKIQEKVRLIERGTLTVEDVEILLIRLRDNIADGKIKELCHFVAHSKRDKGHSIVVATPILENLVKAFQKGGTFTLSPIFKRGELIDELVFHFKKLGIQFNETNIRRNETNIINSLFDFLSDIEIKFKIPSIKEAKLEHVNKGSNPKLGLVITFNESINGLIKVPNNVKIGIFIIE
jgi:hypothetical protein